MPLSFNGQDGRLLNDQSEFDSLWWLHVSEAQWKCKAVLTPRVRVRLPRGTPMGLWLLAA
jgi:hypothetical protein